MEKYSEETKRVSRHNPVYARLKKSGATEELKKIPYMIRDDTTGRRVRYNRFADDWVIGISGSKEFAEQIKEEVRTYLRYELELTLSEEKTKITHLIKDRASYLGFEIGRRSRKYTSQLVSKVGTTGRTRRATNTRIQVYAPVAKLVNKLIEKGFAKNKTKPKAYTKWIYLEANETVSRYNAIMRGLIGYYYMVENKNLFNHIV